MSADNYYRICRHGGKFAAVMGFMSDERPPEPRDRDPHFDTPGEAREWASGQYSEYGLRVDTDCEVRGLEEVAREFVEVCDSFADSPLGVRTKRRFADAFRVALGDQPMI